MKGIIKKSQDNAYWVAEIIYDDSSEDINYLLGPFKDKETAIDALTDLDSEKEKTY